jgi:hypothetical protein
MTKDRNLSIALLALDEKFSSCIHVADVPSKTRKRCGRKEEGWGNNHNAGGLNEHAVAELDKIPHLAADGPVDYLM